MQIIKVPNQYQINILTDKKHFCQNQSSFIQAAILSYYVEIKQQKILAITCFEGISHFAQRHIETKAEIFKFEIQEDMDLLKDKDGKSNRELWIGLLP